MKLKARPDIYPESSERLATLGGEKGCRVKGFIIYKAAEMILNCVKRGLHCIRQQIEVNIEIIKENKL